MSMQWRITILVWILLAIEMVAIFVLNIHPNFIWLFPAVMTLLIMYSACRGIKDTRWTETS